MIVSLKRAITLTTIVAISGVMIVWMFSIGFFGKTFANPVTSPDKALEISENSPSVQRELEDAISFNCSACYMNVTKCISYKEGAPDLYGFLPNDHGVWDATWIFKTKTGSLTHYISLHVYVDEKSGEILGEDGFVFP